MATAGSPLSDASGPSQRNHTQGAPTPRPSAEVGERRDSPRVALPGRLVVVWRDSAEVGETHTILDYGLGGFRLGADSLVSVGRIGRAVHILPERISVDVDVLVVWSVTKPDHGCEFGVRFLGS